MHVPMRDERGASCRHLDGQRRAPDVHTPGQAQGEPKQKLMLAQKMKIPVFCDVSYLVYVCLRVCLYQDQE